MNADSTYFAMNHQANGPGDEIPAENPDKRQERHQIGTGLEIDHAEPEINNGRNHQGVSVKVPRVQYSRAAQFSSHPLIRVPEQSSNTCPYKYRVSFIDTAPHSPKMRELPTDGLGPLRSEDRVVKGYRPGPQIRERP